MRGMVHGIKRLRFFPPLPGQESMINEGTIPIIGVKIASRVIGFAAVDSDQLSHRSILRWRYDVFNHPVWGVELPRGDATRQRPAGRNGADRFKKIAASRAMCSICVFARTESAPWRIDVKGADCPVPDRITPGGVGGVEEVVKPDHHHQIKRFSPPGRNMAFLTFST